MKFVRGFYFSFPFIAFLFGLWYFCLRILGEHFDFVPGDLGDSRFINFLLEHCYLCLSGNETYFWDGKFMFPFQNTIALSESMIGTAPIYAFFRWLNLSPESAYQYWWISICSLNYWISYFIFKKWLQRSDVAVILAWIFAFSIFNVGQLNYMQMAVRFMVPVVLYAAYAMLFTPSLKYLLLYCFGLVIQFYCVTYTGFYLMYFSILFIFILCLYLNKWQSLAYYFKRKNILFSCLIFFTAFTALIFYFLPYHHMSKIVGLRLYKEVLVNLPLWSSYFFAPKASILWGSLFDLARPNVNEWWLHSFFIGFIPLLVIVASTFYFLYSRVTNKKSSNYFKALLLTSLIICFIHLRTENGLSFYGLIFKLPGINSMRVLTRFMHVELFFILLLLGYFLSSISKKYLVLVSLLVFADNMFSPDLIARERKVELQSRKEQVKNELFKHDYNHKEAVALVDTSQLAFLTHLDMMLVAQELKIKTLNGYSSYCPDAYGEFFVHNSEVGLMNWLAASHIEKERILILKMNAANTP